MLDLNFLPVDQEAIVTTTIQPHRDGQVRCQGSWWLARCEQPIVLPPDCLVRVVRMEGIKLWVEPIVFSDPHPPSDFFTSPPVTRCGEAPAKPTQIAGDRHCG
jgi:NfeD-like C-terminal, partner-binding